MTAPTGVVLMAYGTPASQDDILPYYTDIRRGSPPSPEQLAGLTARYAAIGGLSPLTERTVAQRDALQAALDRSAPGGFRVVLGMKHAQPSIEAAVDGLAALDVRSVVGLVLAPHYSAFSVGQYLSRLRAAADQHHIAVAAIDSWATEPAFVHFEATDVQDRLATMPAGTEVVFTAHSLPERIVATGDPYPDQLRATADAVARESRLDHWRLAWQSAGRTPEPWLGPDILQVIDELSGAGAPGMLVAAVGFVADHLEVLYDLDIEAAQRAAQEGLPFARTRCVNDDPGVMSALAGRVLELA
jgi:ferrochelatase